MALRDPNGNVQAPSSLSFVTIALSVPSTILLPQASSRYTQATFSVLHIALIHVFISCFSKSSRTYEGKAEVRVVVLGMKPKSPTMVVVC